MLNFILYIASVIVVTKLIIMAINKLTGKNLKLIKERPKVIKFCKNCGHEGSTKTRPGGSTFWTVFWVIAFAPIGLLYWVSRYGNPIHSCEKCKSEDLVDPDSLIAKKIKSLGA